VCDQQLVQWQAIPGWEGFYEVSDHGEVRSLKRLSRCNSVHTGMRVMGGKILVAAKDGHGYDHVHLSALGVIKSYKVASLVLLAFSGPPAGGELGRHLNGNRSDNRLVNLIWGSHAENMADRDRHGTTAKGESRGMSKISAEEALYIYNSDENGTVLAERFGIAKSKISDIRRGRTWKHVTGGVARPCRSPSGQRRCDKMSPEKVAEVRALRTSGKSLRNIADHFGIAVSTVCGICRGHRWSANGRR
jgi:hypothetical protein